MECEKKFSCMDFIKKAEIKVQRLNDEVQRLNDSIISLTNECNVANKKILRLKKSVTLAKNKLSQLRMIRSSILREKKQTEWIFKPSHLERLRKKAYHKE